ncbi:g6055 [Coccomyxa viridis]|uniref:G6055 protein n=1 Tax=Coccomyxa viridis TaxID=1274662 RepID=A0ABP1FUF5_9CHLO
MRAKRSFGANSIVRAAISTPAIPDIEERLNRYEWDRMNLPDLTGKTALVTGGNSGLGFSICLALAKKNAHVILTARDAQKGQEAADMINGALGNNNVEFMELDVGSFEKIRSFVQKFRAKNQPLHILVNNAGIHVPGGDAPEASGQRTPEGFEVTLGTNYFGHLLLTELLMDKLKESAPARIVNQGSPIEQLSGGVYWDDLKGENKTSSDMQVYGASKLYNIMVAKAWNEKLKDTGIEAFSAHPGITSTKIFDKTDKTKPIGAFVSTINPILGQPEERGASPLLYAAASPDLDGKGGAFIGGPVGALAPITNLDQFKDRETFTDEAKHLSDCMRLYEESLKLIQPGLEGM